MGNDVQALIDGAKRRERKLKADALRAVRKIDRPLARFCLKRWKVADAAMMAAVDMMIFGMGAVRVEHVPTFPEIDAN